MDCAPVLRGFKLPPEERALREQLEAKRKTVYWHHRALTLAAAVGANDTQRVEVAAEAPFLWQELQSDVLAGWDFELRAQSEGVYFQNNPIPIESIAGNGQRPGRLPVPRELHAMATLQVKGTNRTAGALAPQIVLGGAKLW